MYHSVTFGDKNTYDDWHIVPSSRPLFSMPSVKEKYIDLPGSDGSIDLSEAITGYPVYANRTGSMEFIVLNGYGQWYDRYSEIADYLHGKYMLAFLEDDPNWYYIGRFSLNEWRSEKDWSRIVINYNVEPYKWSFVTTNEPWLWDPFNFETGVIYNGVYINPDVEPPEYCENSGIFYPIQVSDVSEELTFDAVATGRAPAQPVFRNDAGGESVTILAHIDVNVMAEVSISAGSSAVIPGLILYNGKWLYNGTEVTVRAYTSSGTATIGLTFRAGRL